ncbi:MAG: hypothetical protein MPJ78_18145 [Hyphomicrobiaceae bacterium]|nr:hypothetical protein [Hyphomicrobiaceae bacterium]
MRAKSLAVSAALAGLALMASGDRTKACCYPVFERSKPHLSTGTIGNSGQPALSSAQTGQSGNPAASAGNRLRRAKPRKGSRRELMILIRPQLTAPAN